MRDRHDRDSGHETIGMMSQAFDNASRVRLASDCGVAKRPHFSSNVGENGDVNREEAAAAYVMAVATAMLSEILLFHIRWQFVARGHRTKRW